MGAFSVVVGDEFRQHRSKMLLVHDDEMVEAPERLPSLAAAMEVATYRIAQEAFTNVVRHAQARTCAIRLEVAGSALQLVLEDDGRGMLANRRAGVGLASMRERAEELGGTFAIQPRSPSGTRVHVVLPLPDENLA